MALELVDLTLLAINVTLVLGLYLYLLGHGLIGYRGTVQVCHVSIVKLRPFEQIEQAMAASGQTRESAGKLALATVEGDVHDIGKNIVRVLLNSYGFEVIDLGRNVSPEKVLEAVRMHDLRVVGLSALMTTTVPAMERTISLLRREALSCRVMVGGAVLTEEMAASIGADGYAADAMGAIRMAQQLMREARHG